MKQRKHNFIKVKDEDLCKLLHRKKITKGETLSPSLADQADRNHQKYINVAYKVDNYLSDLVHNGSIVEILAKKGKPNEIEKLDCVLLQIDAFITSLSG